LSHISFKYQFVSTYNRLGKSPGGALPSIFGTRAQPALKKLTQRDLMMLTKKGSTGSNDNKKGGQLEWNFISNYTYIGTKYRNFFIQNGFRWDWSTLGQDIFGTKHDRDKPIFSAGKGGQWDRF
jgi:hypothetical protein